MTARFFWALALTVSLLPGVAAWSDVSPQLLIPGTFHAEEISAHSGERWLALVGVGDGFALEETVIRVSPVPDQAMPGDKQVAVDGDHQPLFLVRGLPELAPGAVVSISSEPRVLAVGQGISLSLADAPGYTLRTTCAPAAALNSDDFRPCTLTLSDGNLTQGLADFQVYNPPGGSATFASEARPTLIWAGDLDRDGKLDLLLDLTDHYNVFAPTLFLSSRAETGELVGKAAGFTAYGC